MEQLEAFQQRKAKERLDRLERIQKRLQQIRDQSAEAAHSQSAPGRGAVQKPAARPPADRLLKDSTNRVTGTSVSAAKPKLSERAKLVARRLKQPGNGEKTAAGRRLTITLSSPSQTNETQLNVNGKTAKDENAPQHSDVCVNKPALGKR